jgi:hypothetical protein
MVDTVISKSYMVDSHLTNKFLVDQMSVGQTVFEEMFVGQLVFDQKMWSRQALPSFISRRTKSFSDSNYIKATYIHTGKVTLKRDIERDNGIIGHALMGSPTINTKHFLGKA